MTRTGAAPSARVIAFETPRPPTTTPEVGVILLNTAFPRPVGDIGNPDTFDGHCLHEIVDAATIERIVDGDPRDPSLLADFLAARDRLARRGADLITTSCGLLTWHQERMQAGFQLPVVTSALFQIPRRIREHGRIGVMAMDSRSIGPDLLAATGAPADTPVVGLEGGEELHHVLRANSAAVPLDEAKARADVVDAGRRLIEIHPDIKAIVLECANLPPYRRSLASALALPVYDLLTWIEEIWATRSSPRSVH